MPREFAEIKASIWQDDDFRGLSPTAQHLYFVLLTDPHLSYCGVSDWRPNRIAPKSRGWSAQSIRAAAQELEAALLIITDDVTEEVLVRSFLRHDGVMAHNKLCISAMLAFGSVGSNVLRGVIVHELHRLRDEYPEWPVWDREQVREVLKRNAIDPRAAARLAPGVAAGVAPGVAATGLETQPQGQPQGYNNNGNNNRSLSTSPADAADAKNDRDDVNALCDHLSRRLTENEVRHTVSKAWRDAARLLLDRDGRDLAEAHRLIDWATRDEFWKANVLSMPKFREKYDQLRMKARQRQQGNVAALPNLAVGVDQWLA